ncbi:MAG: hypothetical protein JWP00_3966 [Chloroflexi bacterium]|nr:hypothetical protein [Chloroflexota bacterium]
MKSKYAVLPASKKSGSAQGLAKVNEVEPSSVDETVNFVGQPSTFSRDKILSMQRTVGNQAVLRLIAERKEQVVKSSPTTVQRNGVTTSFRRTFGTNDMQKAENPVEMDSTQGDGAKFLKQAGKNQKVFDQEEAEESAVKAKKIEIRNKQRQIKLEMGKPKVDQDKIQTLSTEIGIYKKEKEGQLDTSGANDGKFYSGKIGGATGFAGTVASSSKSMAKVVNPGDKGTIGVTSGSGDNTRIVEVGNAAKGSDVIGGITSLASIAQDVSGIVGNIQILTSSKKTGANSPQRKIAGDKLVDGFLDFGKTLVTTAQTGERMAASFGDAAMANSMIYDQVPILGIVTSIIGLVQTARKMIEQCYRVHKERQLVNEAEKAKDAVYKASLGHLRNRDIQLVANSSVELIVLGLKVAGNAATLSGIGATVGVPLNAAATALGLANKVAHTLADSYKAGLVQENRKQFKDAGGKGNQAAGAASVLIAEDVKHASQTLVSLARKFTKDPVKYARDEMAFKAVKLYGITEKMLADESIPDKDLRALIVHHLQESEDPETLGEQIKNVLLKIQTLPAKVKELGGKPTAVRLMAAIKNHLKYGGKNDRGKGWRFGQFVGGDSAPDLEAGISYILANISLGEKLLLAHNLKDKFGGKSNEWKLLVALNKKP